MTENETIPGAFKALITGYGIIGLDYAYIPATSVPEFSLKGDKPFTIFTTICFKNTQNGSILEQKDMFQMGIMDGLLYVAAIDWCAIKFSEYKVAEFVTDRWYSIAIVYDGKILSAWLEGEKKDSFKCKAPYKGKAEKELCIGKRLDAYFKNFLISTGHCPVMKSAAWLPVKKHCSKKASSGSISANTEEGAKLRTG